MSFRVEIVCDLQTATVHDPQGACHSLVGHRTAPDIPQATGPTLDEASGKARRLATERGWERRTRTGRSMQFRCPACIAALPSTDPR